MSDDIDWDYQAARALLLNLGLSEPLANGGVVARRPYDLDGDPYTSTRLALLLGLPIDFPTRERLRKSLRKALGIDYA